MKQILKYILALAVTFLAGYFVFNEFLDKPEVAPPPTAITEEEKNTVPTSEVVGEIEVPDSEYKLHELYVNPLDGIEMNFPEGFEGDENGVDFGPMVPVPEAPGGVLAHQYYMAFANARTFAEVEDAAKTDPEIVFVSSDLLGSFTAVKYIDRGLCSLLWRHWPTS